ncbi:hypothetical protein KCTCHS21_32190 [Cohnella abietis]|uniref:Uncharacterized protein n=1 Tax=Cohnella abietis TaxID=2507935 RepID=A0A3T1D6V3_9BACL|nr:hypothetical protein KCTCHS21_32190 [Cohnella abietis]
MRVGIDLLKHKLVELFLTEDDIGESLNLEINRKAIAKKSSEEFSHLPLRLAMLHAMNKTKELQINILLKLE